MEDAWNAAGITIDIEMRRTGTHRNPAGRVRDIVTFLRRPAPSRIAERLREIDEKKTGWQDPSEDQATSSGGTVERRRLSAGSRRATPENLRPTTVAGDGRGRA